jgi:hypothetical protein
MAGIAYGGSTASKPKSSGGVILQQPQFQQTPIGSMVGNELYNPSTGGFQFTGKQKGTNAGEALRALAETTGLPLLGASGMFGAGGGAGGGSIAREQMPDTTGAVNAAFARGKDQAGLNARAALTGLQNEMAGRQMLGSGAEAGQTRQIIEHGAAGINEMNREQAIQDANMAGQRASEVYQGNITQRGQDMQAKQAEMARLAKMQEGLLSVINSSGLLY